MERITITASNPDLRIKAGDVVHVTVNGKSGRYRVTEESVEINPFHYVGTTKLELLHEPPVHPGGPARPSESLQLSGRLADARLVLRDMKRAMDVGHFRAHSEDMAGALLGIVELLAKERT